MSLTSRFMDDANFARNGPYRGMSIPLQHVIALSCAGYRPCCVVLVASCPRRRQVSIDKSIVPMQSLRCAPLLC